MYDMYLYVRACMCVCVCTHVTWQAAPKINVEMIDLVYYKKYDHFIVLAIVDYLFMIDYNNNHNMCIKICIHKRKYICT